MWEKVFDIVLDAALDSLKLLPFLFLTYWLMEWLEHRAGEKTRAAIARTGKAGPLLGAALGLVPQCGFSAAAAGLFAGGVASLGTLFAVFLATSDEMLPIFLGAGVAPLKILTVLGVKFAVAVAVGFAVDLFCPQKEGEGTVHDLCDREHCHCERGIFRSALHHTLHISLFVLIVNLALGLAIGFIGEARLAAFINAVPLLGACLAALIGLIPNCAASVLVASLWLEGVISGGAMLAGLLTGAGAGLLVLFRTNRSRGQSALIALLLFVFGAFFGAVFDLTGLAALLRL